MAKKTHWLLVAAMSALAVPARADGGAGRFSLASAEAVERKDMPGRLQFTARIQRDGTAFTEKGTWRWAAVVVTARTGQELAWFALRDNGKVGDGAAGDGLWGAVAGWVPWEGEYKWSVLIKDGDSVVRLPAGVFRIAAAGEAKNAGAGGPEKAASEAALVDRLNRIEDLVREASGYGRTGQRYGGILAALLLILTAAVGLATFRVLRHRPVNQAEPPPLPEHPEQWGPLFSRAKRAREEIAVIEQSLSRIFSSQQQARDRYHRALGDVAAVLRFAQSLTASPQEHVRPFVAKLREVLDQQGVEEWTPEVGQPAPGGCEMRPAEGIQDLPAGAVAGVLRTGLRLREDGEYVLVAKPLVTVVPETQKIVGA